MLEKFLQAKHISIRAEGTTYANADEALQGRGSAGQQRKVRLLMSGFFRVRLRSLAQTIC
jgi:hypothetical protein